jgi:hypothetical protein
LLGAIPSSPLPSSPFLPVPFFLTFSSSCPYLPALSLR